MAGTPGEYGNSKVLIVIFLFHINSIIRTLPFKISFVSGWEKMSPAISGFKKLKWFHVTLAKGRVKYAIPTGSCAVVILLSL